MGKDSESERLFNGWIRVKVPLPFALKWVNSYLIPEPDHAAYTLIDPGLHTEEALRAWERALFRHGIGLSDIRRIVLTHSHPDHYGLAGWFQERTGAPVLLTREAHRFAQRLWEGERVSASALTELFRRHGLPDELAEQMGPHQQNFVAQVSPGPNPVYIEPGDKLEMGGGLWQLIAAPGHASGGLCLYEPDRRWMICGDQVLPRITPNISLHPGEDPDPLASFMDSMEQLSRFHVEIAFPGHRDPFAGFAARAAELHAHHVRRLNEMELLLETETDAFGVCEASFGARLHGNIHNLRFAMAETLAHLVHLVRTGRAEEAAVGGRITFRRAKGRRTNGC
ncbi:hydrolase [Paenibacillus beijingensis]|uniref:Hydrolase n=2 Tax=Paenibacillus beijingensis TaxID=1126833 RepID=A0A0D5NR59_9BACL|nr:hydrolase [Paenibacillus beijingensis]